MTEDQFNQAGLKVARYDLYTRVFLGLVGLLITWTLGYGQWTIAQTQQDLARQQAEDQQRISERQAEAQRELTRQQMVLQTLSLVEEYFDEINMEGPTGERARDLINVSANYLSEEYSSPFLAQVAARLLEGFESAAEDKAAFQIAEATHTPPENVETWFTVVATFDVRSVRRAKNAAAEMEEKQQTHAVEIYRTKYTDHLAITIGGKQSEADAKTLAILAREEEWALDAFPQIDREWSEMEH